MFQYLKSHQLGINSLKKRRILFIYYLFFKTCILKFEILRQKTKNISIIFCSLNI